MARHSLAWRQFAEDLADVVVDAVGGIIGVGYWIGVVAVYCALPLATLI